MDTTNMHMVWEYIEKVGDLTNWLQINLDLRDTDSDESRINTCIRQIDGAICDLAYTMTGMRAKNMVKNISAFKLECKNIDEIIIS